MFERLRGVSRLTTLGVEVAEPVEADRDIVCGLRGFGIARAKTFTDFEALRVVFERMLVVPQLATFDEYVTLLSPGDGEDRAGFPVSSCPGE